MSLVSSITQGVRNFIITTTGGTFGNPTSWIMDRVVEGNETKSARQVSPQNSLQSTAVWACVRVLSETISSLPCHVMLRKPDGSRERLADSPLERLINLHPNERQDGMEFWEQVVMQMCLYGNAYLEKIVLRNGSVESLHIHDPEQMEVQIGSKDGKVYYVQNGVRIIPAEFMMHLKPFSLGGYYGLSPVSYHKHAIGLSLAAEEFGVRFFDQGTRSTGVLEMPNRLDEASEDRLRNDWQAARSGVHNAGKVIILEQGMVFKPISINPDEAQFLETRQYQISDIARIFRMPPHMVGDLERATFSNVEQQAIDFVQHTIRPWLVRLERSIRRHLLPSPNMYVEYKVDDLLRGDIATRYAAYQVARNMGVLNADEIRAKENMEPLPDGLGEIFLVPMNMTPLDLALEPPPEPEPPEPEEPDDEDEEEEDEDADEDEDEDEDGEQDPKPPKKSQKSLRSQKRAVRNAAIRLRARRQFRPLFLQAARRAVKRESQDIRKLAAKHLQERSTESWLAAMDEYYETYPETLRNFFGPGATSFSEIVADLASKELGNEPFDEVRLQEFTSDYVEGLAARWTKSSKSQLRGLSVGEDSLEKIEERLDEWEEKRADKAADNEVVRQEGATTRLVWGLLGLSTITWRSAGDACPLCNEMNGRVVGIEIPFVRTGETVDPGNGKTAALSSKTDVNAPPLHQGCTCYLSTD